MAKVLRTPRICWDELPKKTMQSYLAVLADCWLGGAVLFSGQDLRKEIATAIAPPLSIVGQTHL